MKTPKNNKPRQILVELRTPIIEKFLERCEREKRKPKNLAEFLIEQGLSDNCPPSDADALLDQLREIVSSK